MNLKSFALCLAVSIFVGIGLSNYSFAKIENSEKPDQPTITDDSGEQRVIERFWNLLCKSPRRGTSLDRVYGYYVDLGQIEILLQRCRKQTEERPDDPNAWLLLGLLLSRSGNEQQSVESWQKAISLRPTDLLAASYLGEVYVETGKLRQAVDIMSQTLDNFEKNVQKNETIPSIQLKDLLGLLQSLGRVYERFNDRENADRIWRKIESLFPDDMEILLRVAEMLEQDDKLDEALKRYLQLAELAKNDDFARIRYRSAAVEIKVKQNRSEAAIDDLDSLLDDLSEESWIAISIRDRIERIFSRNADYEGLAAYYVKRIQTQRKQDLETIRRYAAVLIRLSRQDEAKTILSQASEKAPNNIPIRLALIDILVSEKDFDAVDRQYAEIDEIQPNHPDYLTQWGLAILENGNIEENERKTKAAAIWNRLVSVKPNDTATIIMVAESMNSAGIFCEAEKLYRKAIDLKPNDSSFKEYLGFFYHQRKEKDKAVETLHGMVDGKFRTTSNLARLAEIFKSLSYQDDAIETFREAVDLTPDDPGLRLQLIDLLIATAQNEQAETELSEARKLVSKIDSDARHFIETETNFFQTTNQLFEQTERLQTNLKKAENSNAFDFWRLANFQAASGNMRAAETSIGKAIELEPGCVILLQSASKIYGKSGNLHQSVSIHERLVEIDPARRIDYLKQLVDLHRSLGETSKALETARLVMATGAGNPANLRFYATTILEAGRREEGIEILQRAVRLDPNDKTSLSVLADALLESGQRNETLEIVWRIFEKTDGLQGKLGMISRLSELYRQSGEFNRLIERLRQMPTESSTRRESAFYVAQAYVSANRLAEARQTLESLLNDFSAKGSNDTAILSQLSKIAELQGDIQAATEYQEAICRRIENVDESNRLLSLYRLSNNMEKTLDHLLRTVVEKGDFAAGLSLLDDFLASEDYVSARKIVDKLSIKFTDHWELLYRRLTLEFWCNNIAEAEKFAHSILASNLDSNELSALRQKQNQKEALSNEMLRRISPEAGSWEFGQNQAVSDALMLFEGGNLVNSWQNSAKILIKTLFRDRLKFVESYAYNRRQQTNSNATKIRSLPQFLPENFGDAQFAARAWLFRIAFQRDLDQAQSRSGELSSDEHRPPEAKTENLQNNLKFDLYGFLNENLISSNQETELSSEKSGFKFDQTAKTIKLLRASLPENDFVDSRLAERLRLEIFFGLLHSTAVLNSNKFRETDYTQLLFKDLVEQDSNIDPNTKQRFGVIVDRFRTKIVCELAFRGHLDWFCVAHEAVLNELYADFLLEHYDDAALGKLGGQFDRIVRNRIVRELFDDNQIADAKKFLLNTIDVYQMGGNPYSTNISYTNEQKLDFLIRCWSAIENRSLENRPGGLTDVSLIAEQYPLLSKVLRQRKKDDALKNVKRIYENLIPRNPQLIGLWTDVFVAEHFERTEVFRQKSLIDLIDFPRRKRLLFLKQNQMIFRFQESWLPESFTKQARDVSPVFDFIKWKEQGRDQNTEPFLSDDFRSFVEKIKQIVLSGSFQANLKRGHSVSLGGGFSISNSPNPQTILDSVFSKYLKTRICPLYYSIRFAPDRYSSSFSLVNLGNTVVRIKNVRQQTGSANEKRKRTVDRQLLDEIKFCKSEIDRFIDRYFELSNEIDEIISHEKNDSDSVLVRYRQAFENSEEKSVEDGSPKNRTSVPPFQTTVLHNQTFVLNNLISPEQTLFAANDFLAAATTFLCDAEPDSDIEEGETGPFSSVVRQLKTFDLFLESLARLGMKTERRHISAYRTINTMFQGSHIPVEKGIRIHDIRSYLESQKSQLVEDHQETSSKLQILLAAAYFRTDSFGQALSTLDELNLKTAEDIRFREELVLEMFNRSYLLGNISQNRVEKALQFFENIPNVRQTELLVLQQAQERIGKKELAEKSREKLLESVSDLPTQIQMLRQFNKEGTEKKKEILDFALKVFLEPAVQQAMSEADGLPWKAREASLDLLSGTDQLESLIKRFESKFAENSESMETMISLADLYFRAGKMEQTEKIIKQIDEHISFSRSSDLRLYHAFAYRGEMKNKVAQWRQVTESKLALEKLNQISNPLDLLTNFQSYAEISERYGLTNQFIEQLTKVDSEALADSFDKIVYSLERWLEKRTTRQAATELLEHIWKLEKSDEKSKRERHAKIVSNISHRTRQKIFYPLFHEVVFDFIVNSSDADLQNPTLNPFVVKIWGTDRGFGTITTFLDLADRQGKIEKLNEELRQLTQSEDVQKNSTKKKAANLLLAMTEVRQVHASAVLEIVQPLLAESDGLLHSDLLLAQELSGLADPQARKIAATLYRRFLNQPENVTGGIDHRTKNLIEGLLNSIDPQ